jgi:succinate dehydrogenase / fumarate reductase cytochrome b subunit
LLEEPSAASIHGRSPRAGRRWGRSASFRRAHSLTGVVPVGVFLIGHLWTQQAALAGRAAYDQARSGLFAARWLEIVFVLAPLTFHAVFGVVLALRSRTNVDAYPLGRNWMYVAQRVTGLVTFAFVVWHVMELWAPQLRGGLGADQMYPKLEEDLSTTSRGFPVAAVATLVGVACASFHFANGVWGFVLGLGLVRRRSRQAALAAATVVLGIVLYVAGTNAVVYFATGDRMIPLRHAPAARGAPR